jgi:hypothetical protein
MKPPGYETGYKIGYWIGMKVCPVLFRSDRFLMWYANRHPEIFNSARQGPPQSRGSQFKKNKKK